MATIRNLGAALVLLIAFNDAAFGCAACFGASTPETLRAYYISTILLSTMPFVLIACFVIFVRRYRLGGGTPFQEPSGGKLQSEYRHKVK